MKTKQAIDALGSLAHATRLGIFRLLVRRGPEGLAAGTIADRLEVAPATLSFHLTHVMHAGLIEQRRESRSLIYSANFASRADKHRHNCLQKVTAEAATNRTGDDMPENSEAVLLGDGRRRIAPTMPAIS